MDASGKMKIYTRLGDQGETSLIGGLRVLKCDERVEAYGTVDELNSVIGMLRDQKECKVYHAPLSAIQEHLFIAESLLACAKQEILATLPRLSDKDILFLEKQIDEMTETLPVLTNFIIPGGHIAVSWAHIARTVCRRAERIIISLAHREQVDDIIVKYINRLSDYLFVLARRLAYDLGINETIWTAYK
jgi:cob(I)alamin adenosyltransferase